MVEERSDAEAQQEIALKLEKVVLEDSMPGPSNNVIMPVAFVLS